MATLSFLTIILPLAVGVVLLFPPAWRAGAMLACSAGYYLFLRPDSLPVLVASLAFDWLAVAAINRWDNNPRLRRVCAIAAAVKSIALLVTMEGLLLLGTQAAPVLGLHVFLASSLSSVLERYQRKIPAERSPVSMALYCIYFPRLEAGPLLSYQEFRGQLRGPNPHFIQLARGLRLFLEGAVKVSVLGAMLQTFYDTLHSLPADEQSVAGVWCAMLALALTTYYRLSGYAVMAKGVAAMMGITLPHNFYYPYQSQSVTDFFDRFHITVTRFLRRWVFEPLGGDRAGVAGGILNRLLVGMLFGLWFGISINHLLWGVFLMLFALLEQYVYPGLLRAIPTLFLRLFTLGVVITSFAFFAGHTPAESMGLLGRMFGLGQIPFFNPGLGYLLASNWLLLALGLLFATSAVSLLLGFLKKSAPALSAVVNIAVGAGMAVLLLAFAWLEIAA